MKKLILTGLAMVVGAVLAQAQGTIAIQIGSGTVVTNTGTVSGATRGTTGTAYNYELLDITQSQYSGLTGAQQSGIYALAANQADISLWTDSGISGGNASQVTSAGGIAGLGGAGGTSAANWSAPSGASYGPAIDYYTIVGWSASLGSWSTIQSELNAGSLVTGLNQFFGQTATAFNYSGGGPSSLPAVNAFSGSAATGLAGSGIQTDAGALVLQAVPEPATLALAGLGGLSMLFLRRRKS
jgi:hypothetical protein